MSKILIALIVLCVGAFSAEANAKAGVESEIVTFLNKGYHGSVWLGEDGRRVRFVLARATYPDALNPNGFTNLTSRFKEVEFDFFLGSERNNFRGVWFAIGAGRTDMSIQSRSTGATAQIAVNDLHSGVGYAISVARSFYVNPWIGVDVHLDAPHAVPIGAEIWNPRRVDWVGGMKLGLDF